MTDATTGAGTGSADRILTVPNALSFLRLLGVPLFLYLVLVVHADAWALILLIVSSLTDWADGKLARLLDQTSRLGAFLDPMVDRLYVVTTLVALVARDIMPWWIAAILIGREVVLAPTLAVYRRRGLPPPEVLYLGKGATFLLMFALPLLLATVAVPASEPITGPLGWAALIWGTVLYVWTAVLYLAQAVTIARTVPVTGRPG
ncbi:MULTISPECIES: CDP-alcohol phosphatidyltransferase family protein [unclassified Rhodococcus (in: high G+C Gram-positive bacteria)]|jgi:cardiolipin synthase|uniref:CDP-alcohol phosphatidyltransferase family protein n=1 Tax=unclassified Rhodococcus (in: high G+C Gram-positive bacteria) TaxID=192944 RepID=UPI00146B4F64|nr:MULTISPECIES: CDP-alcohol phosphatidyltransferase family protein [unclassified Rhodococcus (in: high G+C Gram-positive bacteria)]MBF0660318.1 CDP-alcohol phosphatidyltransferase family protein [Rhodococcus sp. (in: high G+C Gram-positive bacteria)]NMD97057.1 CDP-alcohol phosphatidyltransferase family protein [Rhodococcus sp. BL-253-APC-6A1W]NME81153.1 CDP-alcohol phosphatidyltransferase family protein [Rhodococcus sp. 105337]